MTRKLTGSPAWIIAVATMAGGFVYASEGSPSSGAVVVTEQDETRTDSVTLLVRGMLKSRSGAT